VTVGIFDEAKHLRGYHGRWAKGVDRSREQIGGVRSANAFHPPTPARERRQRKARLTSKVTGLLSTRDKLARGENVSWRDEQNVMWSSPQKVAEQRAKTGDALIPRADIARKERRFQNTALRPRAARTGIKQTFTGKAKVDRGNYREVLVPHPKGGHEVKIEQRVRRGFDWKGATKHPRKPAAKPDYSGKEFQFTAITSDARVKEIARSMGIEIPKRAGRRQVEALIAAKRGQ
jgi:hypothetical protein